MATEALDKLPRFWRRFIVTPRKGWVRSELEDDFHCMGVTIHHADGVAVKIEPVLERAPWTTCPGAVARLIETFTGVPLAQFAARGEKATNCTHLHDLAVLAAAHADDPAPLTYDIVVSDPIQGRQRAELRRNGTVALGWVLEGWQIVEPAALSGLVLHDLRAWIKTLDPSGQEAARLLRWGTMVAHGRTIPMAEQSDAVSLSQGRCYTFQPQIAAVAKRTGIIKDFSAGTAHPLDKREIFETKPATRARSVPDTAH